MRSFFQPNARAVRRFPVPDTTHRTRWRRLPVRMLPATRSRIPMTSEDNEARDLPTLRMTAIMIAERATGRNPTWARPLTRCSFFLIVAIRAPPVVVRLAWARCFASLIRRVLRGLRGPVDLAVPTALLVTCAVPNRYRNCIPTKVGTQAGKRTSYGDDAGDGAYGTSSRPSHGSVTIPSTTGGRIPGVPAPPPTLTWVPLAGA